MRRLAGASSRRLRLVRTPRAQAGCAFDAGVRSDGGSRRGRAVGGARGGASPPQFERPLGPRPASHFPRIRRLGPDRCRRRGNFEGRARGNDRAARAHGSVRAPTARKPRQVPAGARPHRRDARRNLGGHRVLGQQRGGRSDDGLLRRIQRRQGPGRGRRRCRRGEAHHERRRHDAGRRPGSAGGRRLGAGARSGAAIGAAQGGVAGGEGHASAQRHPPWRGRSRRGGGGERREDPD